MGSLPREISVEPDTALSVVLTKADESPLEFVVEGKRYTLSRDIKKDPLAYYDPERAQRALEGSVGIFKGVDVEQLKAMLREWRGTINWPPESEASSSPRC